MSACAGWCNEARPRLLCLAQANPGRRLAAVAHLLIYARRCVDCCWVQTQVSVLAYGAEVSHTCSRLLIGVDTCLRLHRRAIITFCYVI